MNVGERVTTVVVTLRGVGAIVVTGSRAHVLLADWRRRCCRRGHCGNDLMMCEGENEVEVVLGRISIR